MITPPKLVLASTSAYRRDLLSRLGLEFETAAPGVDESRHEGESGARLVLRLARQKALAVAENRANSLVIGSDQIATLGREILTKPGEREAAVRQLRAMRGRRVDFITGICVFNTASGACLEDLVRCRVHFRDYDDAEIERYLDAEAPYDCAAAFKSELSGIALVSRMELEDPSALIGLPLVKLADMLRRQGVRIP